MASVDRLFSNRVKITAGTLYQPNCRCFLLTVKNASATAIDLRGEDDAVDETVEAIVREINPLAYFTTDSSAGTMMLIMDPGAEASTLQARIRTIGKDADPASTTSIGPNDIDISGSTVENVAPTPSLTTSGTVAFTAAS